MPFNKIHDLMDDATTLPYMNTAHVTRVGLVLNTVAKSRAVVLSETDKDRLLAYTATSGTLNMDKMRELGPVTLQFDGMNDNDGRFVISILIVPMDEVPQITCFPFSNNNHKNDMWAYDKHFQFGNVGDITKMTIQTRDTHPLASEEPLDEMGKSHLSALSAITLKFLLSYQLDLFTLEQETRSYEKLNAKRAKSKKAPLVPDNLLNWK